MSSISCSLCNLAAAPEASPLHITKNPRAFAILHDDWATRGHAMVVSMRHVENLSDLPREERDAFVDLYTRLERALIEVLNLERVVLLKLGLAVPHLHWHLYPVSATRNREDVFAAFDCQTRDEPDEAQKARLVDAIRDAIRES